VKLITNIEPGKEFYWICSDEGIRIHKNKCSEIQVSERYVIVISNDGLDFPLECCYRYLSDIRNAIEEAINQLKVKK